MSAFYEHKTSGRARAAITGVIWSTVNSFLPALISGLVFVLASRLLTPREFGIVALAASVSVIATAFTAAGFADVVVQRQTLEKQHIDSVFWLCLGSGIVAYLVVLALVRPLSSLFGEADLGPFLVVIGLRIVFDAAYAVPNSILVRQMSFAKMAMRTTAASVIAGAVCLAVLYAGFGAWALALSQVTVSVTAFVGTMVSVAWRPSFRFDAKAIRELFGFGSSAAATRLLTTASPDQILIGALLNTTALGLFGFSKRIYDILTNLITGALNSVSYSLLSSLQGEAEKRKEAFLIATFVSSVVTFPIFAGLAAVADDLVPFAFGTQWLDAIPVLRTFCAIGMLMSIGLLQASLIRSAGKADWWFFYMLGKQVGAAAVLVATYSFGIVPAVMGLAIFSYLYWALSVRATIRIIEVGVVGYLRAFVVPLALSLLMAVLVLGVKAGLADVQPALRLGVSVLAGGIFYVLASALSYRSQFPKIRQMIASARSPK